MTSTTQQTVQESVPIDNGEANIVNELTLIRATTNSPGIIPRKHRRGILGKSKFVVIPEVEDPFEYTRGVKGLITAIVGLAGAAAPMGSAVLFPALNLISKDFNATDSITNLNVALYMGSMAVFPMYWSRFSEVHGRRTVYLTSFTAFTLFNLGAALAPKSAIWFLILMRIGSGGSAGAVQAVGAGTIADIWEARERGQAMGWFYLGPLLGPLIAPLIGGGVASKFGWRGTMWFIFFFGVMLWIFLVTSLPETLRRRMQVNRINKNDEHLVDNHLRDVEENASVLSTIVDSSPVSPDSPAHPSSLLTPGNEKESSGTSTEAENKQTQPKPRWEMRRFWSSVWHAVFDPITAIKYIRYPPVALTIWYGSSTFMCLYILNVSLQSTFSRPPYNWPTAIVGLAYIPPSIGNFAGSIVGGRWTDKIMKQGARRRQRKGKGNGNLIPEDRMGENAVLGGLLFPMGLLLYGWTVIRVEAWIVPLLGTFFFGFGSLLIFGMCTTMLTEFIPGKSSSAVAVQNFVRNIFACIGGIVTAPLLHTLGEGVLFSIVGGIALLNISTIYIMEKWGPKWREHIGEYDLT
ncbi:major facilitator superfamily domain-containing protein [Tirmania nivea]|nr:major facilitator superfamily domain-containing protein [Tirmania nivea]